MCLHSLHDGGLLAVLDSASLTAWHTGSAAAVATAPGAATVGIVDAGAQADLVLAGTHPGRGRDDLTVYGPAGLPWQDLAAAWIVYRAAAARGRGLDLDLPA